MGQATLISNVSIFDGSGDQPFRGEVLIHGDRITAVSPGKLSTIPADTLMLDGGGGTLMPGMVEAHAHLAFPSSVERIVPSFGLPPEESLLVSANNARILLDHGFTSAYSAGTLAPRLDIVIRDEIEAGRLPGPRLKASALEQFPSSMAHFFHADVESNDTGPEAIRAYVRSAAASGVDIVKFCLSGEDQLSPGSSQQICYDDAEVMAAGEQARESGVWLSCHAQASGAIKQALRAGFRVLYHCTFADEEAMDLLEAKRDEIFIAPAIGVLQGTIESGPIPGLPLEKMQEDARDVLDRCTKLMPELKRRGIRILPGGDYGFVWNPTGRNARDLELFVKLLGFSEAEALVSTTRLGGELMGMGEQLGLIRCGYLADLLVVDGDPTADISILQDTGRLKAIMKGGAFHKNLLKLRVAA